MHLKANPRLAFHVARDPRCRRANCPIGEQADGARVPALYGTSFVKGHFFLFLIEPFFCSTRAASILRSRPQFPWPSRAGAVKDGAKRHPKGLSLTAPGGTLAAIGPTIGMGR